MTRQGTKRKIVHVFKNGRSRAVRIPKEFDFEGDEVEMTKDNLGNITLHPIKAKTGLVALLATLEPLDEADWLPVMNDSDLLPLDDVDL